jgi:hypothetical protein
MRVALLAVGVILVLRFALLGNGLPWSYYARVLTPELVGDRQYDLIKAQRDRFEARSRGPRYLAVGSSQTEAVYYNYAREHDDLETFIVAAMMPLDFVLYAENIVRRRPETVLLYLSDFDIAKRPSPEATVLSPSQGLDLISSIRLLRSRPPVEGLGGAMVELGLGELLPELKYGFIFRGLVDKQLRRFGRRLGARPPPGQRVPEEERIRWLRESLAEEYVEFNLTWLEHFLSTMVGSSIHVVIVEGHYNPRADNEATQRLKLMVRERLSEIDDRFERVRFIPLSELRPFSVEHYADLTHVAHDEGERFARDLLARIEAREQLGGGPS